MVMQGQRVVREELLEEDLAKVVGGASISGAVIDAVTGIFKAFFNFGRSFGSALRRFIFDSICPLK